MIGYGDTIGIHLIDGHHLDMTYGVIITMGTEWDGLIAGIIEDGHLTNGVILMVGTTTMVGTMGSTIDIEVLT
tara:strand:- start:138 stop:356 length:219 start_codon:yes stop_codon:yes gene_type:complete